MVLIKTGDDIVSLFMRELDPTAEANMLLSKFVSLDDFNECLNLLEDAVAQGCLDDKGEQFDSMALHSYADGIRYLAKQDRVVIVSDVGKRVIARTIKEEVKS